MRRYLIALLLAVAAVIPARADLLGFSFQSNLIAVLLDQISDPGSFEVKASEVIEPDDGLTELRGVTVADNEGVWITIERATLEWTPEALAIGAVIISRLEIEGMTVRRGPSEDAEAPVLEEVEAEEERGLFDWPRAPLTLVIAGIKLEDITIAEGVLPQAISFDATGFVQDQGDVQILRFDVTRTDDVEGTIKFNMRRDFSDDTLTLTLNADEAPGGIVAAAAGFPADSAAELKLEAAGPIDDWKMEFEASVDDVFVAEGNAVIDYEGRLSIDSEFVVTAGEALAPEARAIIGTEARSRLRVEETRPGFYEILEGEIRSPALSATASGQLATQEGVSNLDIELTALAPFASVVPGAEFERVSFDGVVKGPHWALEAAGEIVVEGLVTDSFDAARLDFDARFSRIMERIALELDGGGSGLRIDRITAGILGDADIALKGTFGDDKLAVETVSLESNVLTLDASGAYDLAAENGLFRASLAADDIGPIVAAYGETVDGAVAADFTVDIDGQTTVAEGRIALENLRSEMADADTLELVGRATQDATGTSFEVTAGGEAIRLDRLTPEILGETGLEVSGRLVGDVLTLQRATLTSAGIDLSAGGLYDLGNGNARLNARLTAPDFEPIAAAYGERVTGGLSADFNLAVQGDDITGQGRFALSRFTSEFADAASLVIEGGIGRDAEDVLAFDVTGTGEQVRIDRLTPELLGTVAFEAAGRVEDDTLILSRSALDAAGITLTANGRYELDSGDAILDAKLDAPEIRGIAAAYDVEAAGGIAADVKLGIEGEKIAGQGSVTLTDFLAEGIGARRLTLEGTAVQDPEAGLRFDLAAEGDDLVLDEVPENLTSALALEARGGLAEDGTLTLETATLETPLLAADLAGKVGLESGEIVLDYDLSTADLSPLALAYDVPAAGALTARGRVSGTLEAPRLAGDLSIARARYDGMSFGDVSLSHDVALGDAPEGTIRLSTTEGPAGAATINADFRTAGGDIVFDSLNVQALGLTARGSLRAGLESGLAEGQLDFSSPNLRPLGQVAGLGLSGSASGRLVLSRGGGRQDARLNLALRNVGVEGARIGSADIALRASDLLGTPRISLEGAAGNVAAPGFLLDDLAITSSGPLSGLGTTIETSGSLDGEPLTLSVTARVDASGDATVVNISNADVTYGEEAFRLTAPARVVLAGSTVSVRGLDLALPEGGRIAGDVTIRPSSYAGDLVVSDLSLVLLDRLFDIAFTRGTIDARAVFDTGRGQLDATVTGRDIRHARTRAAVGGLDFDLTALWAGGQFDANATVSGNFGDPLRASLSAPLVPGPGGIPRVASGGALDGRVDWQGDIGDLWTLVPIGGHVLDGRASIALTVGGTLDAPVIGGDVSLTDGTYQNLELGTILTDLTIDTAIRPGGGIGLELSGTDGGKGTVSGSVDLDRSGEGTVVDLDVALERAVLARRDDIAAQVSGTVAVDGPLTDLAVTGDLVIDTAEVRLIVDTPPSVTTLDGIRFVGEEKPEFEPGGESTVSLDISIRAPGRIFVRGRGLESEWMVDMNVGGTATQPRVTGSIEKLRGQLDFIGETFDLARGRVIFDGGREIDPRLDVQLSADANGIVGQIIVEGRVSDPELRFASTPSLPEDEVLPRLLFGRSKQSLTGDQALQLAAGVATLLSGSRGPLDIARDTLGVDTLRVDGLGSESAAVTVGQNLGGGVFVGARQGLGGEGASVTVEVEVFEGVTIDAEAGESGSSVGITLRRDF